MLPPSKKSTSDLSVLTTGTEPVSEHMSDDSSSIGNPSFTDSTRSSSSSLFLRSCLTSAPTSRRSTNSLWSTTSSSVSFGTIDIRDYERVAGDHPETSFGVPLSIGWAFKERRSISVERYEQDKLKAYLEGNAMKRISKKHGGTSANVKPLGALTRKKILHDEFGVPLEEIRKAEKTLEKFKKQLQLEKRGEDDILKTKKVMDKFKVQLQLREKRSGGSLSMDESVAPNKKSFVRSLRKGVMNKLSLREKGANGSSSENKELSSIIMPSPVQIVG
jgi:hypothetical protein